MQVARNQHAAYMRAQHHSPHTHSGTYQTAASVAQTECLFENNSIPLAQAAATKKASTNTKPNNSSSMHVMFDLHKHLDKKLQTDGSEGPSGCHVCSRHIQPAAWLTTELLAHQRRLGVGLARSQRLLHVWQ